MADGMKTFLCSLGLGHHVQIFHTKGFDEEADIPHLTASDLNSIGVLSSNEIVKILKAAQCHSQSSEYSLLRWLRENSLSHYYESFVQSGIVLLSDVAALRLPDEELYDELEITLPGHKKRLEYAVSALKIGNEHDQRQLTRASEQEGEEMQVVTEGWWGFPSYLPNAKFPFLCVQASIKSTRPVSSSKSISFMVDSGSDVSTLRETIIQELNLEPITTVRSCGAYGSQRTTMYKANIIIGDCLLETEVIGSTYDSLGSRVLRNFNHTIDDIRHKWMRVKPATPAQQNNAARTQPQPNSTHLTQTQPKPAQPSGSSSANRDEALRRSETISVQQCPNASSTPGQCASENSNAVQAARNAPSTEGKFDSRADNSEGGKPVLSSASDGKHTSAQNSEGGKRRDETDSGCVLEPHNSSYVSVLKPEGKQNVSSLYGAEKVHKDGQRNYSAYGARSFDTDSLRKAEGGVVSASDLIPSSATAKDFNQKSLSGSYTASKSSHTIAPGAFSFVSTHTDCRSAYSNSSDSYPSSSESSKSYKRVYSVPEQKSAVLSPSKRAFVSSSPEARASSGSPVKRLYSEGGRGDGFVTATLLASSSSSLSSSSAAATLPSTRPPNSSPEKKEGLESLRARQGGQLTLSKDGTLSLFFGGGHSSNK